MEFLIQSKPDNNKLFKVGKKVIDSSILLKNLCEFTEITEPIILECSSRNISIFIDLINHYESITEEHDLLFESSLFNTFTDDEIAQMIQDLSILDSDFFLDSMTDFILPKIEEMNWEKIMEYLNLENDFDANERELIQKNTLEYFLSVNFESMEFPFPNKNFYSVNSKFGSPLNAFLARMILRANERISFQFSLINKAIKNQVDLCPLKMTSFESSGDRWCFYIDYKAGKFPTWRYFIGINQHKIEHFEGIKRRKIIAKNCSLTYCTKNDSKLSALCSSLDFVYPSSKISRAEIIFKKDPNFIYLFDATKCRFSCLCYRFENMWGRDDLVLIEFDKVYKQLVQKELSKNITIFSVGLFNFFSSEVHQRFCKTSNQSKLNKFCVSRHHKILPEFGTFVNNHMEDDGIIECRKLIAGIPEELYTFVDGNYIYNVSDVKQYLDYIISV